MLVDFRPHARLLGASPVSLATSVSPVLEALAESAAGPDSADLSRVRVICDWIQYRENFRGVVDVRPILVDPVADTIVTSAAGSPRSRAAATAAKTSRFMLGRL